MSSGGLIITRDFGYVIGAVIAFYIQQQIIFVAPVAMARRKFGIQAPTLYPRDSEIKEKNLSAEQVDEYMRAQRVHQNNQEFLTSYLPLLIVAGLANPLQASYAAAIVWLGRLAVAFGYWQSAKKRSWGSWFHIPELYTLWLAGSAAYNLIKN